LHVRSEGAISGGDPVTLYLVARFAGLRTVDLPREAVLAAADADAIEAAGPDGPPYQLFTSEGGRLRATLLPQSDGRMLVAVETSDESLAGKVVQFRFTDETYRVLSFFDEANEKRSSGELQLVKVEDEENVWEGRCMLALTSQPHSFLF